MKANSPLALKRCTFSTLLFLAFALCVPPARAGVYQWVGPNREGGSGAINDPNNWDPGESGPAGVVPGLNDAVIIDSVNNSFGTHITLTGDLNVGSAEIFGATMTGTVTVVGGLTAGSNLFGGGDTIFEKSVTATAGAISSGGATFHGAVTASGAVGSGVQFNVENGSNNFVQGSSLTVAHALGIGTIANGLNFPATLNFSGGATGIVHQAGELLTGFNLPSTTAAFMEDGSTFNLSGSGTQFTVDGDFLVGLRFSLPPNVGADAAMNVTAGAKLITNGKTIVGPWFANTQETVSGAGVVTIDGASSQWQAKGDIIVGGPRRMDSDPGSTGVVNVTNGGSLDATGQKIVLGEDAGSMGDLNISKQGSTGLSQEITVGSLGTGNLVVTEGGSLHNTGAAVVGEMAGAFGRALITGAGSKWQVDGNLTIGVIGDMDNTATGEVTVSEGAELVAKGSFLTLGGGLNSKGTLTLNGVGSKLTGTAMLEIGRFGDGTLDVLTGASIVLPSTILGAQSSGSGTITVDGKGVSNGPASKVTTNGDLTVGGASMGTMNITGGGQVLTDAGVAIIGRDPDVTGKVMLAGQDSQWTINPPGISSAFALTIAQRGNGTFAISDHANFRGSSVMLGQNTGSTAALTITGSNGTNDSQMTVDGALVVGGAGTGTVTVSSGGKLITPTSDATLGRDTGSNGTVTIKDFSSQWDMGMSNLMIGLNGTGQLNVTGGGRVTANSLTVGGKSAGGDGNGALEINANGAAGTFVKVTNLTISSGPGVTVKGIAAQNGSPQLTVANNLQVGVDSSTGAPSAGALTIGPGGNVSAGSLTVASSVGTSSVTIGGDQSNDSTLSIEDNLTIGGGTGGQAVVDVNAGGMLVDNSLFGLTINDKGTLNVQGGLFGVDADITIHGGSLNIKRGGDVGVPNILEVSSGAQPGAVVISPFGHLLSFHLIEVINGASIDNSGVMEAASRLNVMSGGSVSATGADSSIGAQTALVTGAGSKLLTSGGHIAVTTILTVGTGGAVSTAAGGSMDIGTVSGTAPDTQIRVGAGGTLKDSGSVTASVVSVLQNGTLGGSGTINGKLINTGKIAPGDPQTLTINGDYEQDNGGLLEVAIAGTSSNAMDHLVVNGKLTLMSGAVLQFDFINGFASKLGDKFDFLSFTTLDTTNNMFSSIQVTGLEPGFDYTVAPDPTNPGSYALVALNDGTAVVPEPESIALLLVTAGAFLLKHIVAVRVTRVGKRERL